MEQIVIAGLALGLFSSLHCIGMCGPIAVALPVYAFNGWQRYARIMGYHTGRVITYTTLGFLFGWFGRGMHIAGLQQWLSVISGALILFFILQDYVFKNSLKPFFIGKFQRLVQTSIGQLLKGKRTYQFILLGMINGLLPCGMVYIALAGTISTGGVLSSATFMSAYGLGTIPAMLALSAAGLMIRPAIWLQLRKATPYLIAFIAVLLILRGLNLDIPFISPVLPSQQGEAVICN